MTVKISAFSSRCLPHAFLMFFIIESLSIDSSAAGNTHGNISGRQYTLDVTSAQHMSYGFSLTFNITVSTSGCLPVLFIRTDNPKEDYYTFSENRCFSGRKVDEVENRNFVNRRVTRLFRAPTCRQSDFESDKNVCNDNIQLSSGYVTKWAIDFGCICGTENKGLDLEYSLEYEQFDTFECKTLYNSYGGLGYVRGGEECHSYIRSNIFSPINPFGFNSAERDIMLYMANAIYLDNNYCYKRVLEVGCHIAFPDCDGTRLIPETMPCYEMCEDWTKGCRKRNVTDGVFFCMGLPLMSSGSPCFYKPVTCDNPLVEVDNAHIQYTYDNGAVYDGDEMDVDTVAGITATYQCNETYYLQGNSHRECQYDGTWTGETPACRLKPNVTESGKHDPNLKKKIAVPSVVLLVLLAAGVAFVLRYRQEVRAYIYTMTVVRKIRRKYKHKNIGKKLFDIFIAHSDKDSTWVCRQVVNNLQRKAQPGYQLCSYHLNFAIGVPILENIAASIDQSRGVMVVLSQDFVNSNWCQYEFDQCYQKALNDPHFHLIVVLMCDLKTLTNMPTHLKRFCVEEKNGNCLHYKDKFIWRKIETIMGPRIYEAASDDRQPPVVYILDPAEEM